MTVEEMLAAVFEDNWPADVNPYRLNVELGLSPWTNPATALWAWYAKGTPLPSPAPGDTAALEVLRKLHRKYRKRGRRD